MNLDILNSEGKYAADSRQIAEMVGRRHDHLLRDIDGYVEILSESTDPKIGVSDFFIEKTYQDSTGRTLRKYDCTRKGCDMIANKMTGKKGVLFTAVYVTKFEEMEENEKRIGVIPSYMIQDPIERANKWIEEERTRLMAENKVVQLEQKVAESAPIISYYEQILKSNKTLAITQIAADYSLSAQALNKILEEEQIQRKVNKQWVLFRDHMGKGYTKSDTIPIKRSNGDPDVTMMTKWTQKGRVLIHNILTKRGYQASLDKELNDAR